jgi:uncharacterized protein YcbX
MCKRSCVHVREIWRYPVKSMGGERLTTADVGHNGISGDRGWGVVDRSTGMVLTARRAPALLFASARVDDSGDVQISLPGDIELSFGADGDRALTAFLDLDVELRRAGEAGGTYENPMNVVDEDDWVSWQGPGGAWHDSGKSRVSIVSQATLGDWDIRRFRTNVVVSGAGEDELVGSQIELGTCRLDVSKRIGRCIMVTRPQPGLDRDLDVLKTIARERSSCLSVGALVQRPGIISVGDQLL